VQPAPSDLAPEDRRARIGQLRALVKDHRRVMSREVVPNHLLYILVGVALFVPSTILVYVAPGIRRWYVPAAVVFIGGLVVAYVAHVVRAGFRLGRLKEELDAAEDELRRLDAQERAAAADATPAVTAAAPRR
jgi:hypothetical protein